MSHVETSPEVEHAFEEAAGLWWLFLVIGTAWLLFAVVVFRFDWSSVHAISILFGIVVIAAAIDEFLDAWGTRGWVRLAHALLGLVFVVVGIVAFVHPGNTFAALAAVMSFYFVLKGALDFVLALAFRHQPLWWFRLILGVAEILIGFWAAGDFGHRTILLVVWVGVVALTRGISALMFAFALREFRNAAPAAA